LFTGYKKEDLSILSKEISMNNHLRSLFTTFTVIFAGMLLLPACDTKEVKIKKRGGDKKSEVKVELKKDRHN
jgi:hypothetical protein